MYLKTFVLGFLSASLAVAAPLSSGDWRLATMGTGPMAVVVSSKNNIASGVILSRLDRRGSPKKSYYVSRFVGKRVFNRRTLSEKTFNNLYLSLYDNLKEERPKNEAAGSCGDALRVNVEMGEKQIYSDSYCPDSFSPANARALEVWWKTVYGFPNLG